MAALTTGRSSWVRIGLRPRPALFCSPATPCCSKRFIQLLTLISQLPLISPISLWIYIRPALRAPSGNADDNNVSCPLGNPALMTACLPLLLLSFLLSLPLSYKHIYSNLFLTHYLLENIRGYCLKTQCEEILIFRIS